MLHSINIDLLKIMSHFDSWQHYATPETENIGLWLNSNANEVSHIMCNSGGAIEVERSDLKKTKSENI